MNHLLHDYLPSLRAAVASRRKEIVAAPIGLQIDAINTEEYIKTLEQSAKEAQEIALDLQHIASRLLYHRNTAPTLTINNLPHEVLGLIFCAAARHNTIAMFAISQTCSHWRHVALRTPGMWNVVTLTGWGGWISKPGARLYERTLHPDLAKLVLDRSASTELIVHHFPHIVRSPYLQRGLPIQRYNRGTLHLLQDYTLRLVELDISVTLDFIAAPWLRENPAPSLRKLRIHCPDPPQIISRFFGGYTPRLEVLELYGLRLPWAAEAFPCTLRELHVEERFNIWRLDDPFDIPDDGELPRLAMPDHPRYALDQSVSSVLKQCPDLEVLSMHRCSNLRCDTSGDQVMTPLALPKLRELSLRNSLADSSHVLRSISISETLKLTITCDPQTTGHDNTLPMLCFLPARVLDHLARVHSIAVSATSVYGTYSRAGYAGPCRADITLHLFCDNIEGRMWNMPYVRNVLTELTARLSLPHIEIFRVIYHRSQAREAITFRQVVQAIEQFPKLKHLALEGFINHTVTGGMPLLWRALRSACIRSPKLLAGLRSIRVKGCHIENNSFVGLLLDRECLPNLCNLRVTGGWLNIMKPNTEESLRASIARVQWEGIRGLKIGEDIDSSSDEEGSVLYSDFEGSEYGSEQALDSDDPP